MFCQSCGIQLAKEASFCSSCGSKVVQQNVQPYEADFTKEDGLFKRIFSKVITFLFMSALLIGIILLAKYLLF